RPGHDDDLLAANDDAVDVDLGRFRLDLTTGQLERLQDALDALDALEVLERQKVFLASLVTDGPDDRPDLAPDHVGRVAQGPDACRDLIDLCVRCSRLQHDDHLTLRSQSLAIPSSTKKAAGWARGLGIVGAAGFGPPAAPCQ